MKPLRLTISAFGPYAGTTVVDFRAAVNAGLFGIYGQTGSGKSTIFSAMTFALFGEPAKGEQESVSLRSDHADPGLATEVELVFDVGSHRYVILRRPEQVRPKQRGGGETRSTHEAWVFDATGMTLDQITGEKRGKPLAERKVKEVEAAVSAILGYGPNQFRQIVLLPQGRFETFLSAKTRDRMEILRDLFDVSLYRRMGADLKQQADAAERAIIDERALCAGRLSAEGFESTEALAIGIDSAARRTEICRRHESETRIAATTASADLTAAMGRESLFDALDHAMAALQSLDAQTPQLTALGARIESATRARELLDPEKRMTSAMADVDAAKAGLTAHRAKVELLRLEAAEADMHHNAMLARAPERDAMRRSIDDLERYGLALARAADDRAGVEDAVRAEQSAAKALADAQRSFDTLRTAIRSQTKAVEAARTAETERQGLTTRLARLESELAAAAAYASAVRDAAQAQDADARASAARIQADSHAAAARSAFDAAEAALADAQAVHLAAKLVAGEPCPVCGGHDHPAPATGTISNAGLDQAFRTTRQARDQAEQALRTAAEAAAVAKSTLSDRIARRDALPVPPRDHEAVAADMAVLRRKLSALPAPTDVAGASAALARLALDVDAAEAAVAQSQQTVADAARASVAASTRYDALLSTVPITLRDAAVLSRQTAETTAALARHDDALATTEAAARHAREVLLTARAESESAAQTLAEREIRHNQAAAEFQRRLLSADLDATSYSLLKPAIATLDADREQLIEFRRQHSNAQENLLEAEDRTSGLSRPDLALFGAANAAAEERLTQATSERATAEAELRALERLRDELADTLARLAEDEARTGPLRGLAAALNGENPQKLDIETFAIGAMFDQVLAAANLRLGPMTAMRYQLQRSLEESGRGRRGLGIEVLDSFTGKARATTTLSGGETFIAALSLALGLADVVESANGKVRLDTIFIDEGFGSLDTENGAGTLDQVLQVLNGLVSQHRAIGLISHVPLVQEAIPNGFYVRKTLSGSTVEERGLD